MIPEQIRAQLAGLGAPVLLPEELQSVLSGRVPGGGGGLGAYLISHPQGYVQIEQPQAISSDGQQDLHWTAVAAIAPTAAVCAALAIQVRAALAGTTREPGRYDVVTPDQPRLLQPGAWVSRPTFSITLLDGRMPQE